jgi:hypothetical protein
VALLLAGCPADSGSTGAGTGKGAAGGSNASGGKQKDRQTHHHHHAEHGPHGGAIVVIGEEAAHVEVVLDSKTGELTAYVYDEDLKNPVWVKQAELTMAVTLESEDKSALPESAVILLKARETKEGAAHEFFAVVPRLKGSEEFDGVLESIIIDGTTHKSVQFAYPEGNEDHHHHHDDEGDHMEKDGEDHDDEGAGKSAEKEE